MTVFTVHAPVDAASASGVSAQADRFVFVRDGFHFWAMVFGPLWLLWNRLWAGFALYVLATAILGAVLALLGVSADTAALVWILFAILLGLEAASIKRWSYSRRSWRQVDFVEADRLGGAERRFFDRWSNASDTPAAPRVTSVTPAHLYGAPAQDIIGSFPQSGATR